MKKYCNLILVFAIFLILRGYFLHHLCTDLSIVIIDSSIFPI